MDHRAPDREQGERSGEIQGIPERDSGLDLDSSGSCDGSTGSAAASPDASAIGEHEWRYDDGYNHERTSR